RTRARGSRGRVGGGGGTARGGARHPFAPGVDRQPARHARRWPLAGVGGSPGGAWPADDTREARARVDGEWVGQGGGHVANWVRAQILGERRTRTCLLPASPANAPGVSTAARRQAVRRRGC